MTKNFNVVEILDAVNSIVSDVHDYSYTNYDKQRIINNYKLFTKKYKGTMSNPETEKIINDAEKFLKNKKNNLSNKKTEDILVLKEESKPIDKKLENILVLKNEYI